MPYFVPYHFALTPARHLRLLDRLVLSSYGGWCAFPPVWLFCLSPRCMVFRVFLLAIAPAALPPCRRHLHIRSRAAWPRFFSLRHPYLLPLVPRRPPVFRLIHFRPSLVAPSASRPLAASRLAPTFLRLRFVGYLAVCNPPSCCTSWVCCPLTALTLTSNALLCSSRAPSRTRLTCGALPLVSLLPLAIWIIRSAPRPTSIRVLLPFPPFPTPPGLPCSSLTVFPACPSAPCRFKRSRLRARL